MVVSLPRKTIIAQIRLGFIPFCVGTSWMLTILTEAQPVRVSFESHVY
jgi:hypothetical protein